MFVLYHLMKVLYLLECMAFKKTLYKLYMIIDLLFVNFQDNQVNQQQQFLIFYITLCLIQIQTSQSWQTKVLRREIYWEDYNSLMKTYLNGYNKVSSIGTKVI